MLSQVFVFSDYLREMRIRKSNFKREIQNTSKENWRTVKPKTSDPVCLILRRLNPRPQPFAAPHFARSGKRTRPPAPGLLSLRLILQPAQC